MNHSVGFDNCDLVKQLIDKKFIPEQAEAIVELLTKFKKYDNKSLVKKSDLCHELMIIKHELHNVELRMTIKFGCMISAALGVVKLFI